MEFQPNVGDTVTIDGDVFSFDAHPVVAGTPFGQEGRQGLVFRVSRAHGEVPTSVDRRALKVFKARFRLPALVALTDRLEQFADLPGLSVCRRTVLTARRHPDLLRQSPDLTYAVLMPWIEGPTWMEVMLDKQ